MNPYNFSLLFFSFCTFFISILIWLNRKDSIGQFYFLYSCAVSIWAAGIAVLISDSVSYDVALCATRIAQAAALFIPIFSLHFVIIFTKSKFILTKFLFIPYLAAFGICFFAFTPNFIPYVAPAVGFKYFLRAGSLFHIYTLMYFTLVPLGFYILYQKIKIAGQFEKIQFKGYFVGTAAAFFGGALGFLPAYGIMVPQYGYFLMPLYPFAMAYFMIRHNLLDVEQVAQAFQREKLATIGLLASSVNHEIKNPLYILKSKLETEIEKSAQSEELGKMLAQVNRISSVITKLNRFAKPYEGDMDNQNTGAALHDAVNMVLDLVSYQFKFENITIYNTISADLPRVKMDQHEIEQVLFNLIVNACYALASGGELMIQAALGTGPKEKGPVPGVVTLTITDTGTGISRDHIKHIFEPFHTTKGEKGTGLGLYITKQIIERSGGKISVESKEGKGTTFRLEFVKV